VRRVLAALVSAAAAGAAHAGRPLVTDDARLLDPGQCHVESYYKESRGQGGSEFWFLPACHAFGAELAAGGRRLEGRREAIVQAKIVPRPLAPGGAGYGFSVGAVGGDAYVNGIASLALAGERAALHANLGALQSVGGTWGLGLEALLSRQWLAIAELYGTRGEKPVRHAGVRWNFSERLQLDATRGDGFYTLGLRLAF
jgi:hypothetical protein